MEENRCYGCVHCNFMTYNINNLEFHFRIRHDGMPPSSVFKKVSGQMSALLRETDVLIFTPRHFTAQPSLQICTGTEASLAISSRIKTERVETASSPRPVFDSRADLSDESEPCPMKLFNSFESRSTIPHVRPEDPDEIKEEATEVDLPFVPSDHDHTISGYEDLGVDSAGKPLLSVDMLAETEVDERDGNIMEETLDHRDHDNDTTLESHFDEQRLQASTSQGAEEQENLQIEVSNDSEKAESTSNSIRQNIDSLLSRARIMATQNQNLTSYNSTKRAASPSQRCSKAFKPAVECERDGAFSMSAMANDVIDHNNGAFEISVDSLLSDTDVFLTELNGRLDLVKKSSRRSPSPSSPSSSPASPSSSPASSQTTLTSLSLHKSPSAMNSPLSQKFEIDHAPSLKSSTSSKKNKKHKKNISKFKRNCGLSYVNSRGKIVPQKSVKERCKDVVCTVRGLDCSKVTEVDRTSIFLAFWSHGDLQAQRLWVSRHVFSNPTKTKINSVSGSRRNATITYTFPYKNFTRTVCKLMFYNTLAISERFVRTVLEKKALKGVIQSENRGGRRHLDEDAEKRALVIAHISKFPRSESHYCQAKTQNEFLSPELTVSKMHEMYKADDDGKRVPVSYTFYRSVFQSMNLKFHMPEKDQCGICQTKDPVNPSDIECMQVCPQHIEEKTHYSCKIIT